MTNREKLKTLLMDVFLLEENEFHLELKRQDVDSWDSLGVVALAVGIQETFHYHMSPDEAVKINSVPDIIALLESKEISFRE